MSLFRHINSFSLLLSIAVFPIKGMKADDWRPESCEIIFGSFTAPNDYAYQLTKEVESYQHSRKYRNKINELRGEKFVNWEKGRIGEIASSLREIIIPGKTKSILDLGCASGLITMYSYGLLTASATPTEIKESNTYFVKTAAHAIVGVELVPGWVEEATRFAGNRVAFVEHDMTTVRLERTFDVIYLADSMEHIPKFRRQPLWRVIAEHSHLGTDVYMHIPTPARQRKESRYPNNLRQHFEEIVLYPELDKEARCYGFILQRLRVNEDTGYADVFFRKV